MTAQGPDKPQKTLRDHVWMLRRHLRLIAATTLLAVAVAVGLSLAQSKTYTANAGINFVDPFANSGIIGGSPSNTPPANLAAAGAARITGAQTLSSVKRTLGTSLSVSQLANDVSATIDPNTLLVTVSANSSTALFAARLADAVVSETKAETDAAATSQFSRVAQNYRTQLRALTRSQRANQQLVSSLYGNIGRAVALSKGGASAADIVFTASPPSSPSSPKPVEDALVGGVLGLLLGVIIALVRETFDRRLDGPREIESHLGLPLVGYVREASLGNVTVNDDFVELGPLDLEAFRVLRTNLEFLDGATPPRTVVVTSARPEEGKTTVASSLAIASAALGRRTLLVECDLRRPQFSNRFRVGASPGLSDFLTGRAELQEIVQTLPVNVRLDGTVVAALNGRFNGAPSTVDPSTPDNGPPTLGTLACIAAGTHVPHPPELLASGPFRRFVQQAAEDYDLVVFDAPPLLTVADTLELVPRVDAILVCVRASRTTREEASAARSALDRFPPRPTGVVVTGLRDARESDYGGYGYGHRSAEVERQTA